MSEDIERLSKEILARMPANKQSIRTTFKVSEEATRQIAWLIDYHGGSAKDIFDAFCVILGAMDEHQMLSKALAQKGEAGQTTASVRKTYVISAGALKTLKAMASKHELPRDALVEFSVGAFKALVDKQKEERRIKYERALQIISKCRDAMEEVEGELKSFLDGDPIEEGFSLACTMVINVEIAIQNALKHGMAVEASW